MTDHKECSPEQKAAIQGFVATVDLAAENNMLRTGKLEGAHCAAIDTVMGQLGVERVKRDDGKILTREDLTDE